MIKKRRLNTTSTTGWTAQQIKHTLTAKNEVYQEELRRAHEELESAKLMMARPKTQERRRNAK